MSLAPEKSKAKITAEVMDITKNSLTTGLLCAIGIAAISKDFSNLVL